MIQQKFFTRALVIALFFLWIIGIITVLTNNTKKSKLNSINRTDNTKFLDETLDDSYENIETPNDSSIIYISRDTISKYGSLCQDLQINYVTAMQIAKQEHLPLIKDRNGDLQPIVYEGDVFVYYQMHSGKSGYFKDYLEYLCLSFD